MLILRTVVLSALTLLSVAGTGLAQGRAAGVTTDLVSVRQFAETTSVFGQVVAGRESSVAVRVAGVAIDSPLQVGDRIAPGDVLLRLDTERLDIELEQAKAETAIARAGLVVAEARAEQSSKALERTRTLISSAAVSQSRLDDRVAENAEAQGNLQQANARVRAAEVAVARAQYEVDNAVIRAPFSGTVLEVLTQAGEFVSVGAVVARILDTSALEIEANVPSRFINALQPDLPVAARTDAGGDLTIMLRAILPTEFSATRTRPVRFTLASASAEVALGQSVTLDVPISAPREVVVVPKDAVVQAAGGWRVFVAEDGKASPRQVQIGASIGDAFEVVSGLQPGDEVVVRGNERLRPGQDIAPRRIETEGQARATPQTSGATAIASNEG